MATKSGLAENASARFSCGSVLANCERHWKQNNQGRQVPGRKMNQHLVVDGRADRLGQWG
ncbi:MAG: hypothetical protein DMG23_03005 [Acidobacteria bacterium]|nr:MAG: hypothetical protein DMG23_03005 [Acidobacteriota bacterium]